MQTPSKIHPIYKWKSRIAFNSNSQPPPKSQFVSQILRHVKSAKYDPSLPQDFVIKFACCPHPPQLPKKLRVRKEPSK